MRKAHTVYYETGSETRHVYPIRDYLSQTPDDQKLCGAPLFQGRPRDLHSMELHHHAV